VIPQDTSLFSDTLEANILYGNPAATPHDISRVVQRCNLTPTLAKMPQGLKTQAGERGARLSGGERQKVSIARAMLKEPTLILCDEVTSAVDAFAERDIIASLKKGAEGRTTILIAHRLSSVVHCDNIIVMENGQIVEQGTHTQLLANKNVYYEMWSAQNGNSNGVNLNLEISNSNSNSHENSSHLRSFINSTKASEVSEGAGGPGIGFGLGSEEGGKSSPLRELCSLESRAPILSDLEEGWLVECEGCDLNSGDHY
jgi:ABC-type multidrug transport system ATPase subunit